MKECGRDMKVLNYGSLNIDFVYDVDHFVRAGETISSTARQVFTGGKGLNQSVALAKAGCQVWHAGAVGKDDGELLLDILKKCGVHAEYIKKTDGSTGHAIIQRDKTGGNCILLFGGANQSVTHEDVDAVLSDFEAGDYLILQNEINELPYIITKAHETGMVVVLNPSPMNEKILDCPLEYVNIFILNEIEAGDILRQEFKGQDCSGQELAERLQARFPNSKLILTLGENGSIYMDKEQTIYQPIYKVETVDTTAAGDTFTGFFIGGITAGKSVKESLDQASKAAAIAVGRAGAAPSIPEIGEVIGF